MYCFGVFSRLKLWARTAGHACRLWLLRKSILHKILPNEMALNMTTCPRTIFPRINRLHTHRGYSFWGCLQLSTVGWCLTTASCVKLEPSWHVISLETAGVVGSLCDSSGNRSAGAVGVRGKTPQLWSDEGWLTNGLPGVPSWRGSSFGRRPS